MLLPSGFYFDCALEGITGRLVPIRETEGDYINSLYRCRKLYPNFVSEIFLSLL